MKILIYSDHFFPSIGGSENYALDLANELTRQGNVVGVITAEPSNETDKFPFRVYRLEKPWSVHNINLNFIEIPQIVKEFEPEIFHISYQTGGENFLIILLRILKIPIVVTYHADHVAFLGRMIDEIQSISTFRLANTIMVQTERDLRRFMKYKILKSKLVLTSFNGIDKHRFRCEDHTKTLCGKIRVICIARLDSSHKYKGVKELINIISDQTGNKSLPDIEFVVVGGGNLLQHYVDLSKDKGVKNIQFLGGLDDDTLIQELCKSDFLILPSVDKAEGFGRVALEAISARIPVIVSRYAGISELIQKYEAGVTFDPLHHIGLIENIRNLWNNPSSLSKYRDQGEAMLKLEHLTLEDTARETLEIYRKVLTDT